jgi:uncharacterized protein RhaS with RHS repeats
MHARHYSPFLGRFLQPDPARVEANVYAYAANGCVSRIDPSGEFAFRKWSRDQCEDEYGELLRLAVKVVRRALEQRRGDWDAREGHHTAWKQAKANLIDEYNIFNHHGCGGYKYRRPVSRIEGVIASGASYPSNGSSYSRFSLRIDPTVSRVVLYGGGALVMAVVFIRIGSMHHVQ